MSEEEKELPFVVVRKDKAAEYTITFSESIEHPAFKYAKLCSLLINDVNDDDLVYIHLSNYGGCCDSAATIVNAIKSCKGHVKVIIDAPSYSAATMIALSGDDLELKHYSLLMFHNFSAGTHGKGAELKADILNTERVIHSMMADLYFPFLSKKEITDIFNDKDVYVHWNDKELKDRLERHFNTDE